MSNADDGRKMICGLTSEERETLQAELRSLPDAVPPRIVWNRIREQAEAEGLISSRSSRRRVSLQVGLGLAAAAALAALVMPLLTVTPESGYPTEPVAAATNDPLGASNLQALMVESSQLESDLRALPAEPSVLQVGTAATISGIEDRIAAIDYQLTDADVQLTSDEEEIFWRERVRLMKLLVRLRYAQAQRTAF